MKSLQVQKSDISKGHKMRGFAYFILIFQYCTFAQPFFHVVMYTFAIYFNVCLIIPKAFTFRSFHIVKLIHSAAFTFLSFHILELLHSEAFIF